MLLAAVLRTKAAVEDLLARGADGETAGIAAWNPHLAAQRDDGIAAHRGLEDLLLAHVVGKAFRVAGLNQLSGLDALDCGRAALRLLGLWQRLRFQCLTHQAIVTRGYATAASRRPDLASYRRPATARP